MNCWYCLDGEHIDYRKERENEKKKIQHMRVDKRKELTSI